MFLIAQIFFVIFSAQAQDSSECISCHDSVEKHTQLHAPLIGGDCISCHNASPKHLVDPSKDSVTTVPPTIENCATCHESIELKGFVHSPVQDQQGCSNCHDPHGSENRMLLKTEPRLQCVNCHKTTIPVQSVSGHEFLKNESRSCLKCHSPHSGDDKNFLVKKSEALCLSCHNRRIDVVSDAGVRAVDDISVKLSKPSHIHQPIEKDGCLGCHSPHASMNPKMLRKRFPNGYYERYEGPQSYEACITCHKQKLLDERLAGDVNEMTKFRSDTKNLFGQIQRKNLHWYHVVDGTVSSGKEHGRSCTICHDPHGSENSHAIAKTWHMSNDPNSLGYNLKLGFEESQKGGSCVLCHGERKSYERIEESGRKGH